MKHDEMIAWNPPGNIRMEIPSLPKVTTPIVDKSNAEPNMLFKMDALRFSKGVLDPSQFLGRVEAGLTVIIR